MRWPRRALLVGLGAASLTKFLHRHRPNTKITVVEIEPRVVAVARQHFKLPEESTHLDIVIADAVDFMMQLGPRYDLILVDGFDAERIRDALEVEIATYDAGLRAAARVWEAAGGFAPRARGAGRPCGFALGVMRRKGQTVAAGGGRRV